MKKLTQLIEKLPELLKNQIKAGEVITRPKDVIKEIMENALDAKADHLALEIKEGGLVSITLRDNGLGISKDQLKLALTVHATSKLKNLEDLNEIKTMGFRGEALASIVSVSRVMLSSNTEHQEHGWAIKASEDVFDENGIKPSSITKGTLLEIRDLFFNAKSRREFLSSLSAETRQIEEVIKKIALSRYHISIQYQSDKKSMDIPKAESFNDVNRLRAIIGENFSKHAIWLSDSQEGIKVYGFITDPQFQRAKGDMQYLYINNRAVKDIALTSSVRRAYQDTMYQKNQPGFVIYIDIDPHTVDVNIHPSKERVRIKNLQKVTSFLFHAISKKLASLRPALQSYIPNQIPTSISFEKMPDIPMRNIQIDQEQKVELIPLGSISDPLLEDHPLGYALSQLHGIYILSQAKDGLILVDMHAAHERVLYEKLKIAYKFEGLAKQILLVPIGCDLTKSQIDCAQENEVILSQLGFDVSFMANACLIRSLPKVVPSIKASIVLEKILNSLLEHQVSLPVETMVYELLSLIACHKAIRANRQLSLIEMNQLLREIEKVPHGSQCNHGRPTWIHFTLKKLDGFFHRGQ
jgi:DNA mismatch repair protein MutL